MKPWVWLIVLFALFPSVLGATIYGAIYDANLQTVNDVELVINTSPKQNHIAKTGSYFFNVPVGSYQIQIEKFYQKELLISHRELIEVVKDGEFEVNIKLNESVADKIPDQDPSPSFWAVLRAKYSWMAYFALVLLIIVLGWLLWSFRKQASKAIFFFSNEHHDDKEHHGLVYEVGELLKPDKSDRPEPIVDRKDSTLEVVLQIIKEEGGRCTQKEIRRKIPLSEAKVSLMIAELEANGKVQKIKKGRGNIIVLK